MQTMHNRLVEANTSGHPATATANHLTAIKEETGTKKGLHPSLLPSVVCLFDRLTLFPSD
jgi:hypothetical protein